MANEKASRPQPRSVESGVKYWPSAERGPNAINAIVQPMAISTHGVRHAASFTGADETVVDMNVPRESAPQRRTAPHN